MEGVKGYKVFNHDWTCRGFQYEVGMIYEEDIKPICCNEGFHFCTELKDCFNYYSFDPDNKVAEIVAYGDIDCKKDGSKCCTNKIKIVREITWQEVLAMVNQGINCTGFSNTGDCNPGRWNTGSWNTGDWNTGSWNTGSWNTGDWNTGSWNTGSWNTGDWNTGSWNTGSWNTGDRNTGSWNTGDRNTGSWNTGDRNTGDWNRSSFNTGCFMTEEQKIHIFNKPSDWSYDDWLRSEARSLLNQISKNVVEWINSSDMTLEEKNAYPSHKATDGYLKVLDDSDCVQIWWNGLSKREKEVIKEIPNFNQVIFEQITGVHTDDN